jgi:hypothetical protein
MTKLVSTKEGFIQRIADYQKEAKQMSEIMPFNRAWYALQHADGWLFGPSKFVGYENLTANDYEIFKRKDRETGGLDGRVTEGVLQRWSELIEEGHPKYAELRSALDAFCAQFGKKPNSLARVSIVRTERDDTYEDNRLQDDLVTLMAAVYLRLTPAQRSAFRRAASL